MFYLAQKVEFLESVKLKTTFQDGKVTVFDISSLFQKFPQLKELENNRDLFYSGKIAFNGLSIVWNDELDISTADLYEDGELIGYQRTTINNRLGYLMQKIMNEKKISQTQLAKLSGINQADISRILCGQGNPTLAKIEKLFKSMDKTIDFKIDKRKIS